MRHSENESRGLIAEKNQQTLQLMRQSVISQAIYLNLKTITDGDVKITEILLADDNSVQKQSSDDHFMSLLRKIVVREENVQAESVEVNFFTRLVDVCFRLSRLYIDTSEGGGLERLFDSLPQVFYDPALPLDDEDEQKQLYEVNDDYYSFFEFCMSFMTSYFFKNASSHVVDQVRTNLKRLLEAPVFYNDLIQAIEQDAEKGRPVEGWLKYLYPLKNNDSIVSMILFYWREQEPAPPRTLGCVPVQSKEIDIQQTMLATVAGVLELMNNFLCRKLKPFRFFCGLNYDFNQGEKKDIERHYVLFLRSASVNVKISTAVFEGNPFPLIKRIGRLEGLIKEFDFLKEHKAFEALFHPELIKQKRVLEDIQKDIENNYHELSSQLPQTLSLYTSSFYKLQRAGLGNIDIPEKMQCALTYQIMTTPVYYRGGQGNNEEHERGVHGRYVYEKSHLERALEQKNKHPHTQISVRGTDFVVDEKLKSEIFDFVENQINQVSNQPFFRMLNSK